MDALPGAVGAVHMDDISCCYVLLRWVLGSVGAVHMDAASLIAMCYLGGCFSGITGGRRWIHPNKLRPPVVGTWDSQQSLLVFNKGFEE